jgi:hypothetical protein
MDGPLAGDRRLDLALPGSWKQGNVMPTIVLILVVGAAICGLVGVVQAQGRSWIAWGLLALAIAVLLLRLNVTL